jgi:dihydropteroate synthase
LNTTKKNFRIYLEPQGILRGCIDSDVVTLPFVGTSKTFSALKIITRSNDKITSRIITLGALDKYLKKLTPEVRQEINKLIENISMRRPTIMLKNGILLDWNKPLIQGVLNTTPDSFSDGGIFDNFDDAIAHVDHMIKAGADIIDVGGESTKPGALPVSIDQELKRVIPVIKQISNKDILISIDSRNADVMRKAFNAGAHIINDVSALTHDPLAIKVVKQSEIPVILMHAQGTPQTMQQNPRYGNVVLDIYDYLEDRINRCVQAGISRQMIMVDPGIGFGKTLNHNLEILSNLSIFHALGVPIVIGVSRKRFIGELSGEGNPAKRFPGSMATALCAIEQGVQVIRVHDVTETRQAITVSEAIHSKIATF